MKVKNGIASSVSFCMMPKMRSGSACSSVCGIRPSSTPMNAEEQAAGAEREGDRVAEEQEDDQAART